MRDRFDFTTELSENVRSRFFIGGEWRQPLSDERLELVSPLTEQVMTTLPGGSAADMDAAIAAARTAFDDGPWPRMSPAERGEVIRRIGQEVQNRLDSLSRVWTAQVGVTQGFNQMVTGLVPAYFDYFANLASTYAFEELRPTAQGHARIVREAVGVCALVLPWNAPLVLLSQKLAAALLAGCTIVTKPSPETPFDALILAECAEKAGLPAGVFNVVPAGREAGDALIRDPRVDKVSFTGSTDAGRHIGAVCADRVARCSLELGGKSAAIICDDANLAEAIPALVPVAIPFSGQICFSQTRLLVSEQRHDEVMDALRTAVSGVAMGDPWDEQTMIGPLSMARQRDRVLGYIEKAQAEGATLVHRGGNGGFNLGYFVEPTIFDDVTPDMAIAQEEVFGPV
ncbi:MAG: aldehyde dehydrogenase family protein, partial [Sphingomonadaceae bacterium]